MNKMTDAEFKTLIATARSVNVERDAMDHEHHFAAPQDCPVDVFMATVASAIECGLRTGDPNALAEAYAMLEAKVAEVRRKRPSREYATKVAE